jgi:hypothetical protein
MSSAQLNAGLAADSPTTPLNQTAAEDAGILTSLDVDLPAGGREFLFRTPRGELEISGYAVSKPLAERTKRLAGLVLLVIVIGGPWIWVTRRLAARQLAARRGAAVRVNS